MIVIKYIYSISEQFPKIEIYGLSNQLRRASVSISSNIAEGSSRSSISERRSFFEIARSSVVEIDTQSEIEISLKYVNKTGLNIFEEELVKLFKMLSGLIKSNVPKV